MVYFLEMGAQTSIMKYTNYASMLRRMIRHRSLYLSQGSSFVILDWGGGVAHALRARRGGAADPPEARHPSPSRLSCSSGGGGRESPDWLCRLSTTLERCIAMQCTALPDAGGYSVGSVCEMGEVIRRCSAIVWSSCSWRAGCREHILLGRGLWWFRNIVASNGLVCE